MAEFGGKGDVQQIVTALSHAAEALGCPPAQDRWYFPSIGNYAPLLERHGFEVVFAALLDRPTPLAGEEGLRHWITMFANDLLEPLSAARREEFLRRVEEELRPTLYRNGTWIADYRRIRIVADKKKM